MHFRPKDKIPRGRGEFRLKNSETQTQNAQSFAT
jgi:hypothetical protein